MTLWRYYWLPALPYAQHVLPVFELGMVVVGKCSPEIACSQHRTDHGNTAVLRLHRRRHRQT